MHTFRECGVNLFKMVSTLLEPVSVSLQCLPIKYSMSSRATTPEVPLIPSNTICQRRDKQQQLVGCKYLQKRRRVSECYSGSSDLVLLGRRDVHVEAPPRSSQFIQLQQLVENVLMNSPDPQLAVRCTRGQKHEARRKTTRQ